MPAKRGRKCSAKNARVVKPPQPQPEHEEVQAEVYVEPAGIAPTPHLQEELTNQPTTQKRARVVRTTTSYSDMQKEDIIEFLKANSSIYEKRRADYKNVQAKDILWQQQADMMETTVNELKTWYNSQRTKLGSTSDELPAVVQASSEAEGDTPTLSPPLPVPPTLPTPVHDETVAIGTMLKEFMAKTSTASPSTAGASYFALYVESTLNQLSGALRREAEHRIQQVLHDVEDRADRQRSQQEVTQEQHQQQQNPQQSQDYENWQPHPSQWPTQLQGQTPSVWNSHNRQWMHTQFPEQRYTSLPPIASSFGPRATEPQPNPSCTQGKTYSELHVLHGSHSEANLNSFTSYFLDRVTASSPLKPVGEDGMNKQSLDLSAVARDSDIPRDLEDDHQ